MEEIYTIIKAVAWNLGISQDRILNRNDNISFRAKSIVCLIIRERCPHNVKDAALIMDMTIAEFYSAAREANNIVCENVESFRLVNKCARKAGLTMFRSKDFVSSRTQAPVQTVSATKRLFGFDWSEDDRQKESDAINNAISFMQKFCRIGLQPYEVRMRRLRL